MIKKKKKKSKILIYPLIIMGLVLMLTNSCKKDNKDDIINNINSPIQQAGTVTDIDSNVYHIVTIGTQVWMEENLKVTHYRNGDTIPNVTDDSQWENLNTGAYCNYNNNAKNAMTYGCLYNWYAVNDSRNLCPAGWHVSTDAEWTTLINYLGGESVAVGKLKETGTMHWDSPNTGATNESGFTALPGGYRYINGTFDYIRDYGVWWSSSDYSKGSAWYRAVDYYYSNISRGSCSKNWGFSVRCLRD